MSRYIDADKAKENVCKWECGGEPNCPWNKSDKKCELMRAIDETPTVDAVPVVRCRDCKWCSHFTDGHIECRLLYDLKPVPRTYMQMREDDYCSYGEKVTE